MDKHSSAESNINLSLKRVFVNSRAHKSLLPAFMCPISMPRAGFELAPDLSTKDRSIQLSYRGYLSFDKEAIY